MRHWYALLGLCSLCLLVACRKADNSNTELKFERLARGSGIWKIERIEDWRISEDGQRSQDTLISEPPGYYQFYRRTEVAGGVLIENDYLEIVVGTAESFLAYRYRLTAEWPRIRLQVGLQPATVYTVESSTGQTQVWTRHEPRPDGIRQRLIYLRYCGSCQPFPFGQINDEG